MITAVFKFLFRRNHKLEIFTDGSAKEGRGAWAYVIVRAGVATSENSGAVRKASSNPMEFRAAIEALKSLPANTTATLYSDSRILIDTMTIWKDTENASELRPRSLETETAELDQLASQHKITWQWIRAHADHKYNERCDQLCIQARNQLG